MTLLFKHVICPLTFAFQAVPASSMPSTLGWQQARQQICLGNLRQRCKGTSAFELAAVLRWKACLKPLQPERQRSACRWRIQRQHGLTKHITLHMLAKSYVWSQLHCSSQLHCRLHMLDNALYYMYIIFYETDCHAHTLCIAQGGAEKPCMDIHDMSVVSLASIQNCLCLLSSECSSVILVC